MSLIFFLVIFASLTFVKSWQCSCEFCFFDDMTGTPECCGKICKNPTTRHACESHEECRKMNGQWSEWEPWKPCSRDCNGGLPESKKNRTFFNGKTPMIISGTLEWAIGATSRIRKCNNPAPITSQGGRKCPSADGNEAMVDQQRGECIMSKEQIQTCLKSELSEVIAFLAIMKKDRNIYKTGMIVAFALLFIMLLIFTPWTRNPIAAFINCCSKNRPRRPIGDTMEDVPLSRSETVSPGLTEGLSSNIDLTVLTTIQDSPTNIGSQSRNDTGIDSAGPSMPSLAILPEEEGAAMPSHFSRLRSIGIQSTESLPRYMRRENSRGSNIMTREYN